MGCSKLPVRGLSLGSGEVSILPSLLLLLCPWGSFVRADLVSGHCASTLPADQAVNVPASLQRPRKGPELGSDPLPGAGAVFWWSYRELGPLVFMLQIPISADGAGKRLG